MGNAPSHRKSVIRLNDLGVWCQSKVPVRIFLRQNPCFVIKYCYGTFVMKKNKREVLPDVGYFDHYNSACRMCI